MLMSSIIVVFIFDDPATTKIYTLSLHDALPIYGLVADLGEVPDPRARADDRGFGDVGRCGHEDAHRINSRSEEHTSELQSQSNLVCRLLLEKKKKLPIRRSSRTSTPFCPACWCT